MSIRRAAALGLAGLLAGTGAHALDDTDTLYCAQVYAEAADMLARSGTADAAALADDAQRRAVTLGERDYDLLNESPRRHARASLLAQQRLAALPAAPGASRHLSLRMAYDQCRDREDAVSATQAERVDLLGRRRFCRDLMTRTAQRSADLRKGFSATEAEALDELQRIAGALARPLPGRPVTPREDTLANELLRQQRQELDAAVAGWKGREDPMVAALNRCHDDYAAGRLGGPDVLASAAPAPAAIVSAPAGGRALPTAAPAGEAGTGVDLGEVFHVRETVTGGGYEGIWRRRGTTSTYDGYWVHLGSGQVLKDVLEVRGVRDGVLQIHRTGSAGDYQARVRPDGSLAEGSATWSAPGAFRWQPLPKQTVRFSGGSLGVVVHVREMTAGGDYAGIWRRRGRSNVYDALWVHVPSGETLQDIVVVAGARRGYLELQRPQRRVTYRAPLAADGRLYGGWVVEGERALNDWIVLPSQPVSVPAASSP